MGCRSSFVVLVVIFFYELLRIKFFCCVGGFFSLVFGFVVG